MLTTMMLLMTMVVVVMFTVLFHMCHYMFFDLKVASLTFRYFYANMHTIVFANNEITIFLIEYLQSSTEKYCLLSKAIMAIYLHSRMFPW